MRLAFPGETGGERKPTSGKIGRGATSGAGSERLKYQIAGVVYTLFSSGSPLCSGFSPGSGKSVSASFSMGS